MNSRAVFFPPRAVFTSLMMYRQDLARAQQERDVRPWVIVAGHRPVYARESAGKDGRITYGSSERYENVFCIL